MRGIAAYGAYVPGFRLTAAAIAEALGTSAANGARAVASYDEDTTTLGVEAARIAMRRAPHARPDAVVLATTAPAYLDKANAAAVHAALGLDAAVLAMDAIGSVRSASGALRLALEGAGSQLVVGSDIRVGRPGGEDERAIGDAASAVLVGEAPADALAAEYIGGASTTAEVLDRWRLPGDDFSRTWEERFAEQVYPPLASDAVGQALKAADLVADDIDHLVVTGLHRRAAARVARAVGGRADATAAALTERIGATACAHPGVALAAVLDVAEPGAVVALVVVGDGADVLLFRVGSRQARPTDRWCVAEQVGRGREIAYATYLTWRGLLDREPPRRPDPVRPSATRAFRAEGWKFAFAGCRCDDCGTRHLPPQRVCVSCHAVDRMTPEAMADVPATVATFSIDHLAYSLNPPNVVVALDFDGGGRYQCILTEADPAAVAVGDRVEMTFRRMYTAQGVHNYFWKAKPLPHREAP